MGSWWGGEHKPPGSGTKIWNAIKIYSGTRNPKPKQPQKQHNFPHEMPCKAFPIFCSPVSRSVLFIQHISVEKTTGPANKLRRDEIYGQLRKEFPSGANSNSFSQSAMQSESFSCGHLSAMDTPGQIAGGAKVFLHRGWGCVWAGLGAKTSAWPHATPPGVAAPAQTLRWNVCAPSYATFCLRAPKGQHRSTQDRWNRTERKEIVGRGLSRTMVSVVPPKTQILTHPPTKDQGQPRTHTDVYQSRDAGKAEEEYGFGFHFAVTLAATNRRNVRCLLHLTSTFFNHPLSRSPLLWSGLCNGAHQSWEPRNRSQNLIDFDFAKFDVCHGRCVSDNRSVCLCD